VQYGPCSTWSQSFAILRALLHYNPCKSRALIHLSCTFRDVQDTTRNHSLLGPIHLTTHCNLLSLRSRHHPAQYPTFSHSLQDPAIRTRYQVTSGQNNTCHDTSSNLHGIFEANTRAKSSHLSHSYEMPAVIPIQLIYPLRQRHLACKFYTAMTLYPITFIHAQGLFFLSPSRRSARPENRSL